MTRILNRKLIIPAISIENAAAEQAADNLRVKHTNGTTAVQIFGAKGAPADLTVTSFVIAAKDTTAGNITLEHGDGTDIAVVAKGVTTGVLTAEESLASTPVKTGDALQIKSSSAGNAVCFITYTFDA